MKKMGIIYGSSTGTCESIAQTIAEKLGVASVDVIDASKITTEPNLQISHRLSL